MMSILLISLGFICCLVGLIGSVLPVVPGLIISWLGILLLFWVPEVEVSSSLLWITLAVTLLILILDYIIPILGTKKLGGSKFGMYGAGVGLVVGFIAPIPLGILIGPFVGAYLGEVVFAKKASRPALKAALGSFLGFLTSTVLELMASLSFFVIFMYKLIQYKAVLF
jgi:uncharacterized protein YqgC (DUF456 family)